MKCPKCHYLSFDPEPRCRNCGYTLALDPDLTIHPESPPAGTLADFALRDVEPGSPAAADGPGRARATRRAVASAPRVESTRSEISIPGPFDDVTPGKGGASSAETADDQGAGSASRLFDAEATPAPERAPSRPAAESRGRRPQPPPATSELPLFVKGLGDDVTTDGRTSSVPLEPAAPAVSVPPLSVRRSRPDHEPRPRPSSDAPRLGPLDHDLLEGLQRIERDERRYAAAENGREYPDMNASVGRRVGAAMIDGVLLAGISAAVVSATLRWAGLDWGQWTLLPATPLAAFVLLIVVGYLFMFTAASGQTAGKMVTAVRVVDAGELGSEVHRVSARQALYRSALTVPSVLLLGVGLIPALTGDRRTLHDRLTRTRVVRA